MPVSAPNTEASSQYTRLREQLRIFLLDRPGLNPLLANRVEFTDDQISLAVEMMLSRYNTTPPTHLTARDIESVPLHLRLIGTAGYLLRGISAHQLRNQVNISSDDDEAIGLFDKAPQYSQMGSQLLSDFEQEVSAYKIAQNHNSVGGQVGSGYTHGPRAVPRRTYL